MAHESDISIRDSRDRVIDILGFGETYPLRDLPISDKGLTVPFSVSAKIPIVSTQQEALYELYDPKDQLKGSAQGTGRTLLLESPPIEDDVTYQVKATKNRSGRSVFLHETATVKVGLDVTLQAQIMSGTLLEPGKENPDFTDPRIVDHGIPIKVKLEQSQEGVDYKLVYFESGASDLTVLSETVVRGNLDDIIIDSKPVFEDVDVRILATKTFDPSEDREEETALLNVVLPLKIRANQKLDVAIAPSPIINYKETTTLQIEKSQKSAQYQLYIRSIPDRDIIHGAVPEEGVITVPVKAESRTVEIRNPRHPATWEPPEGYVALGIPKKGKKGTGGKIQFSLKGLTDGSLIIVRAEKRHQAETEIASSVQLEQTAVVLVQPDPAPQLNVKVWVAGNDVTGPLEVSGGQTGVFYYFRKEINGKALGRPAYFHKKDDDDPESNKGLGQLTIGVDFVMTRRRPDIEGMPSGEPAKTFPANPKVDIETVAPGTNLHIMAVKAQTGLSAPLLKIAEMPPLPKITLENEVIDSGAAAKVIVEASLQDEKYQLFLSGEPVRHPRKGNDKTLSFTTEQLTEDTTFEMVVTRPNESSVTVERVVTLTVAVRPVEPG